MRQLRKTNMEYEERNAALQKHVESMRGAVERLEGDVMQERGRNGLLRQHLETLRQALTSSFSSVPLPGQTSRDQRQPRDDITHFAKSTLVQRQQRFFFSPQVNYFVNSVDIFSHYGRHHVNTFPSRHIWTYG